jgi:hypothetical protein
MNQTLRQIKQLIDEFEQAGALVYNNGDNEWITAAWVANAQQLIEKIKNIVNEDKKWTHVKLVNIGN